jgi:hypothetical protein
MGLGQSDTPSPVKPDLSGTVGAAASCPPSVPSGQKAFAVNQHRIIGVRKHFLPVHRSNPALPVALHPSRRTCDVCLPGPVGKPLASSECSTARLVCSFRDTGMVLSETPMPVAVAICVQWSFADAVVVRVGSGHSRCEPRPLSLSSLLHVRSPLMPDLSGTTTPRPRGAVSGAAGRGSVPYASGF